MFTVKGEYFGRPFVVTWEDGEYSSRETIVEAIEEHIAREPYIGLPCGPFWKGDAIKNNSFPAFLAIEQALGKVTIIDGELDVPKLPKAPKGSDI